MRARVHALALLGLALGGAPGCLLYLDSINVEPQVRVERVGAATPLRRGQSAEFTATVTDKNGGEARLDWGKAATCPASLQAANMRLLEAGRMMMHDRTAKQEFTDKGHYCVFVVATDAQGAQGFGTIEVDVLDRELLLDGPMQAHRGKEITFTASYKGEPDAVRDATFAWTSAETCKAAEDDAKDLLRDGQGKKGAAVWRYEPRARGSFCVAVAAIDDVRVTDTRGHTISTILNSAPIAGALEMVRPTPVGGPIGIFTDVRISAPKAADPDPDERLTFEWALVQPDGTRSKPAPCPDAKPAGSELCFKTGDVEGSYRVELVLKDEMTQDTAEKTFEVKDTPPCLRMSEPDQAAAPKFFWTTDEDPIFRVVQVEDDGDPVPPPSDRLSQRQYIWSVRSGTTPSTEFEYIGTATLPTFRLARSSRPFDDTVQVRVEYRDRVTVKDPDRGRDFSKCKPNDTSCELRPGCFQWVTWTVVFL